MFLYVAQAYSDLTCMFLDFSVLAFLTVLSSVGGLISTYSLYLFLS